MIAKPRRGPGWFRRRRNRRVRLTGGSWLPVGAWARAVGRAIARQGRVWLTLLLVGALGGAGYAAARYLTRSSHFALRVLRFEPTGGAFRHVTADELKARAGVDLGVNLFSLDLARVARDVARDPWVANARARRELPQAVVVEVSEREAACAVALEVAPEDGAAAPLDGALYLADADGVLFKRATVEEAAALPVVTGIARDDYLAEPSEAEARIRDGLAVLAAWQRDPGRPALGEVHLDRLLGATAYTRSGALGVRLGPVDPTLDARLRRYDVVAAALARSGEQPRFIYLDNRARPDRVTVKLAAPADVAHAAPTAPQPPTLLAQKSET